MENTLPAAEFTIVPARKLHRTVEDRAVENYIAEAGKLLTSVRLSPEMAEVLINHGFDDEELAIGMGLQESAAHAFASRHDALAPDQADALATLTAKIEDARDEYQEFRGVARASFTGLSDRINLRVTGDVPDDLQTFMSTAEVAYTVASSAPYTEKLSKRGYPPARLGAMLEALDLLATLDTAHELAEAQNQEGDSAVDATYTELKEYMKQHKGVIRAVFRKKPALLRELGLT